MSPRWVLLGTVLLWCTAVGNSTGAAQAGTGTPRATAAKLKSPVASTPSSIKTGQQLYSKYCRFCHGTTGKGDSAMAPKDMKPSNLTDTTWVRGSSAGEIFVVIQEGAGPKFDMKGLKGTISDQDTWHLVNYVRSLGGVAQ